MALKPTISASDSDPRSGPNSASASNPAFPATPASSIPHSAFPTPHSDGLQSDDAFADLSALLRLAQSAERRLERIFDINNPALNHLSELNVAVQALWRLVAIRKSLYRLSQEIKNPSAPNPFGVQASACLSSSEGSVSSVAESSPSPSAPSAFFAVESDSSSTPSPVFSEPSVSPPPSVLKNSSSSSSSSFCSSTPHSAFPIPHSLPSPSVPTPNLPFVNVVPEIPAARIADIHKIHAFIDDLEDSIESRADLCKKMGIPADPLGPGSAYELIRQNAEAEAQGDLVGGFSSIFRCHIWPEEQGQPPSPDDLSSTTQRQPEPEPEPDP